MLAAQGHVAARLGQEEDVLVLDDNGVGDAARDGRLAAFQHALAAGVLLVGRQVVAVVAHGGPGLVLLGHRPSPFSDSARRSRRAAVADSGGPDPGPAPGPPGRWPARARRLAPSGPLPRRAAARIARSSAARPAIRARAL